MWALTIAALVYSCAHFAQSGVRHPLDSPNLGKFEEETPALERHLRTGQAVRIDDNEARYGPAFFFVVHPFLAAPHTETQLANRLYGLQLACVLAAFLFTWATVRPLVDPYARALVAAWLAVVWLNFAPLYMTIAIKSVENWELALLSIGLFAYVRGRLWIMGFAVAAAALVKVLPLIFFYYLLIANRRAFAHATAALVVLLGLGHVLYGPMMGFGYLPHVAMTAVGKSYGILWHENLSLKAAIVKLFGHLGPATPKFDGGYVLQISDDHLRLATALGDAAVLVVLGVFTWTLWRQEARSVDAMIWEWSLVSVVMLIVSPNTTFEYATMALGAISYGVVKAADSAIAEPTTRPTWVTLGVAMLLLGALLPRSVLNRVTFVTTLNQLTGYTHLRPSEAYQYYCLPLVGLLLLTAALWRMRPAAPAVLSPRLEMVT